MNSFHRVAVKVALVFLCLGGALVFSACSGDDDDNETARVVDMFFDDNVIRVGEGSVLRIRFTYSSDDVFDDGENVVVVVRLPVETTYREGTAEIQGIRDDDSVGAQRFNCESGEQYLLFDLDDNDLDSAENPSGDADAELSLTLDGVMPAEVAVVQAAAEENSLFFSCGAAFNQDRDAGITIVGAL